MPWPSSSNVLRGLWGLISSGSEQGMTTSELWDSIRSAYSPEERQAAGLSASAVSTLRGMAGSVIAGRSSLADAIVTARESGLAQGITSDMVGRVPWARSLEAQALAPKWAVIYNASVRETAFIGGYPVINETTQWQTLVYEGQLPPTVDDLASDLDALVDSETGSPPGVITGYSTPTILAV